MKPEERSRLELIYGSKGGFAGGVRQKILHLPLFHYVPPVTFSLHATPELRLYGSDWYRYTGRPLW